MRIWTIDFLGLRAPLDSVPSVEPPVSGVRLRVEAALDGARDPAALDGLECVIYSESETEWGIRFEGPPEAVHYAVSLVGDHRPPQAN